ncbi:glycosyltransferase, family GT4 [Tenacibaculum sp. 190524A02b]|uniref:Glyco_trans_4-like_N domain-containing protein n=1 Tax=Tenacibaculum vairaonense TaxID=3137860 RepID=A0ABM9PHM8_9FLAO
MKVLIITYYWVPSGGSGVQRWLKFVKYLRDFGIEPIIFTVENPSYPIIDTSLIKDIPENLKVIKSKIWDPNSILSKIKKEKPSTSAGFLDANPSLIGKVLQYIRANYFIPDARKFWIRPAVKTLEKYIVNNHVDLIITTGPPHTTHLIGLQLKKKLGLKWIADFRDPWTEIDYFHQLPLTKSSLKKHYKLEKEVLKSADCTIVVGKTMKESYKNNAKRVEVLTNGYDKESENKSFSLDSKFSITHIGLMNADRNPIILWEVLAEIASENKSFANDLEIKLIGKVAEEVIVDLEKFKFENINRINYVPHDEVLKYQKSSQVLLLAVNKVPSAKGIITGKIFEYLQARRPILAIGPEDGDLAEILKETNAGFIVGFNNKSQLKEIVVNLYNNYLNKSLEVDSRNIAKYHRKNLTEQLSQILKEIHSL